MKLDRNINPDGRDKYALVNLRRVAECKNLCRENVERALAILHSAGVLSYGNESPGGQFFVMKYKDKLTAPALEAYAKAASQHGMYEFAVEMFNEQRAAAEAAEKLPD